MRARRDEYFHIVGERPRPQNARPCHAGSQQSTGRYSRDRAKQEIAHQVLLIQVQSQCRQSPPLLAPGSGVKSAQRQPVGAEQANAGTIGGNQ